MKNYPREKGRKLINMENWKRINQKDYDPEVEGNFKYLGKHFKHRKEIVLQ